MDWTWVKIKPNLMKERPKHFSGFGVRLLDFPLPTHLILVLQASSLWYTRIFGFWSFKIMWYEIFNKYLKIYRLTASLTLKHRILCSPLKWSSENVRTDLLMETVLLCKCFRIFYVYYWTGFSWIRQILKAENGFGREKVTYVRNQ